MLWGWSRINDHEYRFDSRWSVRKDWAIKGAWYVELDGKERPGVYPSPVEAIEAADRWRNEQSK